MFKIMKMKTLFVAALATMFLVACNKDAEPTGTSAGNGGGKTNFAVSLPSRTRRLQAKSRPITTM